MITDHRSQIITHFWQTKIHLRFHFLKKKTFNKKIIKNSSLLNFLNFFIFFFAKFAPASAPDFVEGGNAARNQTITNGPFSMVGVIEYPRHSAPFYNEFPTNWHGRPGCSTTVGTSLSTILFLMFLFCSWKQHTLWKSLFQKPHYNLVVTLWHCRL